VTANDAKISYTDAAVTSVIHTANIISSSAQIATDISGSFFAPSASFSTRVTANDAKVTNSNQSLVHLAVTSSNVIFGEITASGNISASGTIVGSNLSGTNTGDQNISNLAVTSSNVIFGNITASGNISASGTLTTANANHSGSFIHSGSFTVYGGVGAETSSGTVETSTFFGDVDIRNVGSSPNERFGPPRSLRIWSYNSSSIILKNLSAWSETHITNGFGGTIAIDEKGTNATGGGRLVLGNNSPANEDVSYLWVRGKYGDGGSADFDPNIYLGPNSTAYSAQIGLTNAVNNYGHDVYIAAQNGTTGKAYFIFGRDAQFKAESIFVGPIDGTAATGAITASGHISASGTIVGSNLSGTNTGDQNISNLAVTSSNVLFGEITASGNISSSGNVYAADYFDNGANISTLYAPVLGGNDNYVTDTQLVVIGNTSGTNTGDQNISNLAVTSSNVLFGDITSSGDISASGDLYGDVYYSNNIRFLVASSTGTQLGYVNTPTEIDGTHIKLDAPVTASTISSSDYIYASNIVAAGNCKGNQILAGGQVALKTGDATLTGKLFVNPNTTKVEIGQSGVNQSVNIFGQITSSGHISASGTIVGSNLSGTNTGDVTVTGTPDYITLSNQVLTRNQIVLTTDVTGVLPSANLDADTAHLTTTQTFTGAKTIETRVFAAPGGTDGNICGDIVKFGTTDVDKGKVYYFDSTGIAGDCWTLTNATTVANSKGLLAVAMGDGNANLVGMCIKGRVNLSHTPGAIASVLYLSEDTPGFATSTSPAASDEVVRIIGYALTADGSDVWFNPDSTYVEIA